MGLLSTYADPEPRIKGRLVDLDATIQKALDISRDSFAKTDERFKALFPGMVETRDANIANARDQLDNGPSARQNEEFINQAIGGSIGAFGSGSDNGAVFRGAGLGGDPNSLGANTAAASIGTQAEGFQDSARKNLQDLIAQNPEREFLPPDLRFQLGLSNVQQAIDLKAAQDQAHQQHLNDVRQAGQADTRTGAGILTRL